MESLTLSIGNHSARVAQGCPDHPEGSAVVTQQHTVSLFSSSHSVDSQVKILMYFGHVSRMHDSKLLKVMMFGQVKGPRCVGLPRNQKKMKKKCKEKADLE